MAWPAPCGIILSFGIEGPEPISNCPKTNRCGTKHTIATRFALWIIVVTLFLLGSCVGIPVRRKTINHIVGTSWMPDGRPVALAQKFSLGKTAYVASPEGPGVFEHYRSGSLALLIGGDEVPVELEAAEIRVENAAALPGGTGFLVILDISAKNVPGSVWRCFKLGVDGSVTPCRTPEGYLLEEFAYYLAPTEHEIRFRRSSDAGSRFEALNIETGELSDLAVDLKTLPLRWARDTQWPSAPCDMSYSRLAPRGDRLAVACAMPVAENSKEGLWLLDRDDPPRMAYEFMDEDRRPALPGYERTGRLEEMVTWPREEYSLAWSPDQEHLYWCGGRGAAGVSVSLRGDPAVEHTPCLLMATWSPDGTKIAGVRNGELAVWDILSGQRPISNAWDPGPHAVATVATGRARAAMGQAPARPSRSASGA